MPARSLELQWRSSRTIDSSFLRVRAILVPTFRSSYTISAITFYELRKAMGTSKFMVLVPLFDLKSLGSFRRLRCRDFKSAALGISDSAANRHLGFRYSMIQSSL